MKTQPAAFLKLLVLLVPREMEVSHKGGVKSMTDEELERGIEAIQVMLAARDAGANAKVIEAVEKSPSPGELEGPTPRPDAARGDAGHGQGHEQCAGRLIHECDQCGAADAAYFFVFGP